jgi:hypothetical protein
LYSILPCSLLFYFIISFLERAQTSTSYMSGVKGDPPEGEERSQGG